MLRVKSQILLLSASLLFVSTSFGATQLSPIAPPLVLSNGSGDQTPDLDNTAKAKLVRLSNGSPTHGRLISVFADAWGDGANPMGHTVYDVKADLERPARDIYIRYSDDDGVTWSAAVNISNTASLTSIQTEWQGNGTGVSDFHGDSDKPNVFNNGNNVVVSWGDKFCDPAVQGSITYAERNLREIPFSCMYAVRSKDGGKTFTARERLSDGSRDAKQDVNRGTSKAWIVTWQEDPGGLLLGEAEGPGDGASGANVAMGTDIWYSYVQVDNNDFGSGELFKPATRVTNNWTMMEDKHNTGNEIESGETGASRANIGLVGGTVILAYEESKGSKGTDMGKYIRYHSFAFNKAPATLTNACVTLDPDGKPTTTPTNCATNDLPPNPDMLERIGCILSKPERNARRVRFIPQGTAGSSGTRLFVFWRQGEYGQGGPADIVGRSATDFADLASFSPALNVPTTGTADGCLIRGDMDAVAVPDQGVYTNSPALNLSHNTPYGGDLTADSEDNPLEDARAHRGFIRGNTIVLGYSYSPDGILARTTDMEHYNFWIRRSLDGGASWDSGTNISEGLITDFVVASPQYTAITQIDVKEPRIVKTPGNGPATCPSGDPADATTTDPSECNNPDAFVVVVGLVENTDESQGAGKELDLFITRSMDAGATYEIPVAFTSTPAEEFESQIRTTPALDRAFAVWNSNDADAGKNAHFVAMDVQEIYFDEDGTMDARSKGGSVGPLMIILMSLLSLLSFYSRRVPRS